MRARARRPERTERHPSDGHREPSGGATERHAEAFSPSPSSRPYRTLSNQDLAGLHWRVEWRMRVVDVSRPPEKRWWYMPLDRATHDGPFPLVMPGLGWPSRQAAVDELVRQLAGRFGVSVPEFYVRLDEARELIAGQRSAA